jgi:hypothetical protein
MPADYGEYFRQLEAAIDRRLQSCDQDLEKIEKCFKHGLDHWARVQEEVKKNGFATPAEEIFFFREVKPRFTSLIEYYTRRYHALLFLPAEDKSDQARFWKWELRKIERFFENQTGFCRYIREGATDKDEQYFLRAASTGTRFFQPKAHDLDPETLTSHDPLLTMMIAMELYKEFIQGEIKKLEGYFFVAK